MPVKTLFVALLLTALPACGSEPAERGSPDSPERPTVDTAAGQRAPGQDAEAGVDRGDSRPETRTDTLYLEGMPEPIRLSLFRSPEEFPLHFSTYVPADMAATVEAAEGAEGEGGVRFVAEFGGQRSPDAFVHLFVFPPGTDRNAALAQARGYKASRGIPVSRGLEPLSDEEATRRMPWALESYAFRYQSGGDWFAGSIGIGEHAGRHFQLIRHYPAEYVDGFGPRASLITRTWRWGDGTRLMPGD